MSIRDEADTSAIIMKERSFESKPAEKLEEPSITKLLPKPLKKKKREQPPP
jgi:hypothetical protein